MCSCEPPRVVQNVADDEEEPARDAQDDCDHLAGRVVFRLLRVLPEEPVGRQQHQANRCDMLLEIEEALRLPVAGLLNGDAEMLTRKCIELALSGVQWRSSSPSNEYAPRAKTAL